MTEKPYKYDNLFAEPEYYFHEGRFQPDLLAQDMVDHLAIITLTTTREIFGWQEGYYEGGSEGESLFLSRLSRILGKKLGKVSRHDVTELLNQVRLRSFRVYEIFDSDLDLLPLDNGVLNTQTLEFEPYDKARHYFMFKLPVKYDPKADCPNFRTFVSEIVYADAVPVVQEVFGYCLWRDGIASIKKAVMLLGPGDNGKSLLLDVLITMLGRDNIESISLTSLSENRFASANLRGKLANVHPDLSDRALRDTGTFKGLLGDDPMPYEVKHGGQGKFWNRAKLIFAANRLPDTSDDSSAYFVRWVILSFPFQFVRHERNLSEMERPAKDKTALKQILTTPEELAGILNWSLNGLQRLRANGCFTNEISPERMREMYVKLASPLKAFLLERCEVTADPEDYISKQELYAQYARYCEDRKLGIPFTKEKVGRELPSCVPGKIVAGRDYVGRERVPTWRGIHLKDSEDPESTESQTTLADSEGGSES